LDESQTGVNPPAFISHVTSGKINNALLVHFSNKKRRKWMTSKGPVPMLLQDRGTGQGAAS
jgi:hypothetical protein